jgi:hypothetical protein
LRVCSLTANLWQQQDPLGPHLPAAHRLPAVLLLLTAVLHVALRLKHGASYPHTIPTFLGCTLPRMSLKYPYTVHTDDHAHCHSVPNCCAAAFCLTIGSTCTFSCATGRCTWVGMITRRLLLRHTIWLHSRARDQDARPTSLQVLPSSSLWVTPRMNLGVQARQREGALLRPGASR